MGKLPFVDRRKTIAVRAWLYVSRPFQITRLLELLYMFNWILYAGLSFLPEDYTSGSLFRIMHVLMPDDYIRLTFVVIAFLHIYALIVNVVWLRKIALLFNIGLLLYIVSVTLQSIPFSAGIGYLIILIGISIFAFWRMDESA
jgi:hypothetical protein